MLTLNKINDLSDSPLRKRFLDQNFVAETNVAVAMGRVSTKGQKDRGRSDEAQIERICDYADVENLVIKRAWDVAETASRHHRRKNFIEMLEFVKANPEIKHMIFSHQSRVTRNRESAREVEVLVRSHGVTLHAVRDGLKLTSQSSMEDWLRWDLFNNLNEKAIKDHTKNVIDGVIRRIERGLSPHKAPFGYKNFRPSENAESIFVFAEGAEYMRTAFELCATGLYSEVDVKKECDRRFPGVERKPTTKRLILLR